MNLVTIKECVGHLKTEIPFLSQIQNKEEYAQALSLMDMMTDNDDGFEPVITILANSISHWEDTAPELSEFNQKIAEMDGATSLLIVLMDQHQTPPESIESIIGNKELTALIMDGTERLSMGQIKALAEYFNVKHTLFLE